MMTSRNTYDEAMGKGRIAFQHAAENDAFIRPGTSSCVATRATPEPILQP
jgi:hypothetical protein